MRIEGNKGLTKLAADDNFASGFKKGPADNAYKGATNTLRQALSNHAQSQPKKA